MNKLNIDDVVRIKRADARFTDHGKIGPVVSMQKWPDGTILYTAKIHFDCKDGGPGWDSIAQFKDGEYEVISKAKNKKG